MNAPRPEKYKQKRSDWRWAGSALRQDGRPLITDGQLMLPKAKLWRKVIREPGMLPDKYEVNGQQVTRKTMLLVADTIESFMNGFGDGASIGYDTIAAHSGLTEAPVIKAVRALGELEWFAIDPGRAGSRHPNGYKIALPADDPRNLEPLQDTNLEPLQVSDRKNLEPVSENLEPLPPDLEPLRDKPIATTGEEVESSRSEEHDDDALPGASRRINPKDLDPKTRAYIERATARATGKTKAAIAD